ncbi:hypothetical protein C6341_g11825 [Phytophthora cactorum]|nr:hypothetical protein C6341_g11825 [Phytophthora cactorum]
MRWEGVSSKPQGEDVEWNVHGSGIMEGYGVNNSQLRVKPASPRNDSQEE